MQRFMPYEVVTIREHRNDKVVIQEMNEFMHEHDLRLTGNCIRFIRDDYTIITQFRSEEMPALFKLTF